jgi:hypothetical protein
MTRVIAMEGYLGGVDKLTFTFAMNAVDKAPMGV